MAQNKPNKPSLTLPQSFGGVQEPLSSSLIENGYEASIPQIIEGGNLNWTINALCQNTTYMRTVLDYVRDTPSGKMFWVNTSGKMDYIQPAIIASDSEFSTGTATDKTPNVKQVVDKINTKANNNAVVHKTGTETITGNKTFTKEITEKVDMTRGTAPAASMYPKPYIISDSADNMVGNIQFYYSKNRSAALGMLVYNCNDTTDNTPAALQVYNDNGTKYATCPTPTEDTTGSIQIDTVGARNTKLAAGLATKQATITGAATTITSSNLTASRAVIAGSNGKIGVSDTTSTELHYVHGVTSAIQTQLNAKATPANITSAINSLLSALYPVGSLYITTNNSATCPLASLINGSKWSLVAADKALWTSNRNGNTTINAGLPNITGAFNQQCLMNWTDTYARGALYQGTVDNEQRPQNAGGTDGGNNLTIAFDASKSNSIYGKSSTVQPPAYRVNVWRRTE